MNYPKSLCTLTTLLIAASARHLESSSYSNSQSLPADGLHELQSIINLKDKPQNEIQFASGELPTAEASNGRENSLKLNINENVILSNENSNSEGEGAYNRFSFLLSSDQSQPDFEDLLEETQENRQSSGQTNKQRDSKKNKNNRPKGDLDLLRDDIDNPQNAYTEDELSKLFRDLGSSYRISGEGKNQNQLKNELSLQAAGASGSRSDYVRLVEIGKRLLISLIKTEYKLGLSSVFLNNQLKKVGEGNKREPEISLAANILTRKGEGSDEGDQKALIKFISENADAFHAAKQEAERDGATRNRKNNSRLGGTNQETQSTPSLAPEKNKIENNVATNKHRNERPKTQSGSENSDLLLNLINQQIKKNNHEFVNGNAPDNRTADKGAANSTSLAVLTKLEKPTSGPEEARRGNDQVNNFEQLKTRDANASLSKNQFSSKYQQGNKPNQSTKNWRDELRSRQANQNGNVLEAVSYVE